jgi:hypothetical protein
VGYSTGWPLPPLRNRPRAVPRIRTA